MMRQQSKSRCKASNKACGGGASGFPNCSSYHSCLLFNNMPHWKHWRGIKVPVPRTSTTGPEQGKGSSRKGATAAKWAAALVSSASILQVEPPRCQSNSAAVPPVLCSLQVEGATQESKIVQKVLSFPFFFLLMGEISLRALFGLCSPKNTVGVSMRSATAAAAPAGIEYVWPNGLHSEVLVTDYRGLSVVDFALQLAANLKLGAKEYLHVHDWLPPHNLLPAGLRLVPGSVVQVRRSSTKDVVASTSSAPTGPKRSSHVKNPFPLLFETATATAPSDSDSESSSGSDSDHAAAGAGAAAVVANDDDIVVVDVEPSPPQCVCKIVTFTRAAGCFAWDIDGVKTVESLTDMTVESLRVRACHLLQSVLYDHAQTDMLDFMDVGPKVVWVSVKHPVTLALRRLCCHKTRPLRGQWHTPAATKTQPRPLLGAEYLTGPPVHWP
jgi:hypothetical protein